MFGFQMSMFVLEKTGVDIPWWVFVFGCIAVIAWMGVNRVDLSARCSACSSPSSSSS